MNKLRGILDMDDPFDIHAYFLGPFTCSSCGAELLPAEPYDGWDDLGCRHLADEAKRAGWFVPLMPPSRHEPLATDPCYCPQCARDQGLRP